MSDIYDEGPQLMFVVQTSHSSPLAVLGGHYHNIVAWLIGGGEETKQGYEATYDDCQSAFILVCRLPTCLPQTFCYQQLHPRRAVSSQQPELPRKTDTIAARNDSQLLFHLL
jgi:hypothetical protein